MSGYGPKAKADSEANPLACDGSLARSHRQKPGGRCQGRADCPGSAPVTIEPSGVRWAAPAAAARSAPGPTSTSVQANRAGNGAPGNWSSVHQLLAALSGLLAKDGSYGVNHHPMSPMIGLHGNCVPSRHGPPGLESLDHWSAQELPAMSNLPTAA